MAQFRPACAAIALCRTIEPPALVGGRAFAADITTLRTNIAPPNFFILLSNKVHQAWKNAYQTPPRINTARQVLIISSASTDGPGSAWRASVGVSIIIPCFLIGMELSLNFSAGRNSLKIKNAKPLVLFPKPSGRARTRTKHRKKPKSQGRS
jgi:hypothetical protein